MIDMRTDDMRTDDRRLLDDSGFAERNGGRRRRMLTWKEPRRDRNSGRHAGQLQYPHPQCPHRVTGIPTSGLRGDAPLAVVIITLRNQGDTMV
jgi:hypothetical protein